MKIKDIDTKINLYVKAQSSLIKKRSSKIVNYEDLPKESPGNTSGLDIEEMLKFIDEMKSDLRNEFPNMNKIQEIKNLIIEGKKDHEDLIADFEIEKKRLD